MYEHFPVDLYLLEQVTMSSNITQNEFVPFHQSNQQVEEKVENRLTGSQEREAPGLGDVTLERRLGRHPTHINKPVPDRGAGIPPRYRQSGRPSKDEMHSARHLYFVPEPYTKVNRGYEACAHFNFEHIEKHTSPLTCSVIPTLLLSPSHPLLP